MMYLVNKTPVFGSSYAEIELECLRFLQLNYPNNIRETTPLDILSLEDHLFGYKLAIFDELEDTTIEAYTDFERKAIFIPLKTYDALIQGHHNNRERFTTTHEAGHVLLHREYFANKALVAARTGHGKIKLYMDPEWQANAAAGALLMPLTTFYLENKRFEMMGNSFFSRVMTLAAKFQVSEKAVEQRLKTLENNGIKDLIRRFDM